MRGKRDNEDWVKEKLFKSGNIYFGVIFMSESPQHLLGCSWMCEWQEMRLCVPPIAAVKGPHTRGTNLPIRAGWGYQMWLIIFLILKKRFKVSYTRPAPMQTKARALFMRLLSLELSEADFYWSDRKQQEIELRGFFRPSSEDCSLVLYLAASSETWASGLYFCNPKWIAEFNFHWNSCGDIHQLLFWPC